MTAAPVRRSRVPHARPESRAAVLLIACSGAFLAFLDTTIVNVSFPDITASFPEANRSQLSWVLDGYFIALAALLVPAGGVADRLGRRRTFLAGLAAFVVTSAICAAAPSWEVLVAARVLQGLAAAVVVPVSIALILPLYPVAERARGVGFYGAASALAAALGPPLGGVLVEVADWRWIFLVNLPVGLAACVAGAFVLRETVPEEGTGWPDLLGAVVAAAGLGLLALAIVEGGSWGWTSGRVLASLALGVVLLAVLGRRCVTHPRPLVAPGLMRLPAFAVGNLGTLLFAVAFFATILGNILFLTGVWGYSALEAGLAVAPGPVASTLVAGPAAALATRHGFRAVVLPGVLVYAAGLVWLRAAGAEPDYLGLWLPAQVVVGIGTGLAFPNLGAAASTHVRPDDFASASSVISAFRQFGAVLGTAVVIAIIGTPSGLDEAMGAADDAYLFSIGAALAAALAALALRPPGARQDPTAPA